MAYQQRHDGRSQPRQQRQQQQQQYHDQGYAPQGQQQHAGYDQQYDQQYYDYGYDQHGYDQHGWDDGYYEDPQAGYGRQPQQQRYDDRGAQGRQQQPPQGRRPPPPQPQQQQQQAQYGYDQGYDMQQPQRPRQGQGQDPRPPMGRGNPPPPEAQQGRGGLRPPGELSPTMSSVGSILIVECRSGSLFVATKASEDSVTGQPVPDISHLKGATAAKGGLRSNNVEDGYQWPQVGGGSGAASCTRHASGWQGPEKANTRW